MLSSWTSLKFCRLVKSFNSSSNIKLFTNQPNLDSSKLKEFADDNSKFDKIDRKFFKKVDNNVGTG